MRRLRPLHAFCSLAFRMYADTKLRDARAGNRLFLEKGKRYEPLEKEIMEEIAVIIENPSP
jgi:hypothetical protein